MTTQFAERIRQAHADTRSPCPLDVSPDTVLGYSCGSFSMVVADLSVAFEERRAASLASALTEAGVADAFELRRELISFKKACLVLFHDVQRLEQSLLSLNACLKAPTLPAAKRDEVEKEVAAAKRYQLQMTETCKQS